MNRDNYFATKRGPKPEPLCPELQMFAATQDFLRGEMARLRAARGLMPLKKWRAWKHELQGRAQQLHLDVTAWMLRNAA